MRDDNPLLGRKELVQLFDELAAELHQAGIRAELFTVRGGAIALAYSTRRETHDIDGVFEPKAEVYAAAKRVAERHDDLDDDWLNDAFKGYLPGDDPNATTVYERPGLQVRVASPEYLLAMKVLAARIDRDADDIRLLADTLGLNTVEEVLDVVETFYPTHLIETRVQSAIEEILADPDLGTDQTVATSSPRNPLSAVGRRATRGARSG